jgi:hypothetical protein
MFLYNQAMVEAQGKRSEMLEAARQHRLAIIAQSGKRRFRFLSWRLPDFRRPPVTLQSDVCSQSEVRRKTTSKPAW